MKRAFMLDSNAVRWLLERRSPQLDTWLAEERCSLSAVVDAEIRVGQARRRLSPQRQALVEALLAVLTIESFDSHALSLGRALVSLNQAFEQVPGLELVSLQNR